MPSGAFGDQAVRRPSDREATFTSAGMAQYQAELARMIGALRAFPSIVRSEEHTSELQSLMRISYAVFCLKKKIKHHAQKHKNVQTTHYTHYPILIPTPIQ